MIAPDTLPVWFAIPTMIVATVAWFLIEIHHAVADPDPQLSRLDRLDGLDSRTG